MVRSTIPLDLYCDCTTLVHPAILATCKFIFNEALPSIYGNFSPRLVLPSLDISGPINNHTGPLARLPAYGLPYITNVLLVGAASDTYVKVNEDDIDCQSGEVDNACWEISCKLPNVKSVRLHFDLDHDLELDHFEFKEFTALHRFSKLEAVQLELWSCTKSYDNTWDILDAVQARLERTVDDYLVKYAEKTVAVTRSSPRGHSKACICCRGVAMTADEELAIAQKELLALA